MAQLARPDCLHVVDRLEGLGRATALNMAELALARRALERASHVALLTFDLGVPSEQREACA